MGFEQSKFGDGSTAGNGNVTSTVSQHYGARDTGKTHGVAKTEGFMNELTIDLDGDMLTAEAFPLMAPYLPAGSRIEDVYMEVTEAFALSTDSSTATVEIGTETSEATNGFSITEAQLEALGVYDLTSALSGTWAQATGLTADTTVGIDLAGDVPVSTSAGKARLVVRYVAM